MASLSNFCQWAWDKLHPWPKFRPCSGSVFTIMLTHVLIHGLLEPNHCKIRIQKARKYIFIVFELFHFLLLTVF